MQKNEFHIGKPDLHSEPDAPVHDAPLEVVPVDVKILRSLVSVSEPLRSEITAERHDRAIEGAESVARILRDKEALEKAEVDAITGLPNRAVFERDLGARVGRGKNTALVICDLNQLKVVNDTLSHQDGDIYLRETAEALRTVVREGLDKVYKLGGDEFAVLLDDVQEPEVLGGVIGNIQESFGTHVRRFAGIDTGLSVGGHIQRPEDNASSLFAQADAEMQANKEAFYAERPNIVRRGSTTQ